MVSAHIDMNLCVVGKCGADLQPRTCHPLFCAPRCAPAAPRMPALHFSSISRTCCFTVPLHLNILISCILISALYLNIFLCALSVISSTFPVFSLCRDSYSFASFPCMYLCCASAHRKNRPHPRPSHPAPAFPPQPQPRIGL